MLPSAASSITFGRESITCNKRKDVRLKALSEWMRSRDWAVKQMPKMVLWVECSKYRKKSRAFKIEISMVSGSVLAAEICTDPHNRLLRRQHGSSLCEQSELQCFASDLRQMSARCADEIFRR